MLDCCSPRYYGRGRAISLLSGREGGPIIGPRTPVINRLFPFLFPFLFRTRADRFLIFCHAEHAGEGNVSRNERQGRREFRRFRLPLITLISNPLAKVVVSFPFQRLRACIARDRRGRIIIRSVTVITGPRSQTPRHEPLVSPRRSVTKLIIANANNVIIVLLRTRNFQRFYSDTGSLVGYDQEEISIDI